MGKADVVIVGGGIAGLSAAVTLSEANLNVVLVERRGIGANQSVRAVFSDTVQEFDLKDSVLQGYTGFVWHSPLGAIASFDYQRVAVDAVDYGRACEFLCQRATRRGLKVIRAKALRWSPAVPDPRAPLVVHLDNGDSIQAQVLIDASGSAQWAARRLGMRPSLYYSVCYGELLTGCNGPDAGRFRFLAPNSRFGNGGGWYYPAGGSSVSIGYSIVVQGSEKRSHLAAGYWSAKREFHPYADWVRPGIRQRIEGGVVPVGRIGRFVFDRILIVGDAAGQAYPWSVEGCRPCLYNGRLCAQVVLQAFAQKCFDRATLFVYERDWAWLNRERFWRTASVAELTWARSDQGWDQFIAAYQQLSPEQQIESLRENRVAAYQQIYAVAGYARRQLVKWLGGQRS